MPAFRPSHESAEPLLSVEEAQARILGAVPLLPTEMIPVAEADGRVLRAAVTAAADAPRFDNSAMDGYAVHAADVAGASPDTPVILRVTGEVAAGGGEAAGPAPGEAVRIMTGAPVPSPADAVVPVEWTDAGSSEVRVTRAAKAGANIRRRGEDMRAGDVVVLAGTPVGAGEIGAIAAARSAQVEVSRRPLVTVIPTGDELVDVEHAAGDARTVNSNALALAALVRSAGAIARVAPIVPDRRDATIDALRAALDCDFVVTTGGVSVGAFDFVKEAVAELGGMQLFWRVAMKPGKPVLAATIGRTFFLGLPGNPVSSVVAFHLFVAPALRQAMGQREGVIPPVVQVRAGGPIRSKGDRRTYVRARLEARDGQLVAQVRPAQGSGVTTSLVGAQALVIVPEGVTEIAAGSMIDAVLIAMPQSS